MRDKSTIRAWPRKAVYGKASVEMLKPIGSPGMDRSQPQWDTRWGRPCIRNWLKKSREGTVATIMAAIAKPALVFCCDSSQHNHDKSGRGRQESTR